MSHTSPHLRRAVTGDSEEPVGQQSRRYETYGATLSQLSQTPLLPELYSRVQYQFLARYLSTAPVSSQQLQNGGLSQTQQPSTRNNSNFIHVVVHTFSNGTQTGRKDYGLEDGLQVFMDSPQPEPNLDQIVFVRGSLSPAWVGALGIKYKIDPEFFRRHLRYLPGRDYSDLPSLPSAATDMLTLLLPSLYTRSPSLATSQVRKCREKDSDVVRKNQQAISGKAACGETVIRRFSTLSDRLFSIEHEISIFTRKKKNGGQLAVVLLDSGLEMNQQGGPPCFSRQDSVISSRSPISGITSIPVIVPRPPKLNIKVSHPAVPTHNEPASLNSICHVASLLPFYFGMSLNTTSAQPDIISLMCELFRLVTSSECQFLNQLNGLVQDQQLHPASEEQMDLALNTLRCVKSLSEEHEQRLSQNMTFLKTRCSLDYDVGVPVTPRLPASTPQHRAPEELLSILNDFIELVARAESLGAFCIRAENAIITNAMLRESQKAIQRADDQRRLTVLAYLFLPLSLVFSLFGMNVKELGTGSRNVWLPFVVLVPVGCISLILFYIQKVRRVLTLAWEGAERTFKRQFPDYHTQGATIPLRTSRDNGARRWSGTIAS